MRIYRFREMLKEDKIQNFPKNLIVESLIKSWEYEDLIKQLQKIFDKENKTFSYKLLDYCLLIYIKRKDVDKNLNDKIENILKLAGYGVANYEIKDIVRGKGFPNNYILFGNYDTISLELNKKFDTKLKGIPIYMYHVTENKNLKKIDERGLIPLSKNKLEQHPDRIYLFDNLESAKYFKQDLKDRYDISETSILKIDVRLVNNITLYEDPKFGKSDFGACYTYNNISSFAIIEILN